MPIHGGCDLAVPGRDIPQRRARFSTTEAVIVNTVSIGVCAYNEVHRMDDLFESIRSQSLPETVTLKEILVVASGCTDGTDALVEERARADPRVTLIRESERLGKSSALNLLLRRYQGDLLILLNADARLLPGSLTQLLKPFIGHDEVQLACGAPVLHRSPSGLTAEVLELSWRLHNRTLNALSVRNLPNHCCDELMAMRKGFVHEIPTDLINDGAYFGVLASLRGRSVHFCPEAEVMIEVPLDLADLLQQRRRILRGHQQIRSLLHRSPNTFEGLFRNHSAIALLILLQEMRRGLRWIGVLLCFALPLESVAKLLAIVDRVRRRPFPTVWATVRGVP